MFNDDCLQYEFVTIIPQWFSFSFSFRWTKISLEPRAEWTDWCSCWCFETRTETLSVTPSTARLETMWYLTWSLRWNRLVFVAATVSLIAAVNLRAWFVNVGDGVDKIYTSQLTSKIRVDWKKTSLWNAVETSFFPGRTGIKLEIMARLT